MRVQCSGQVTMQSVLFLSPSYWTHLSLWYSWPPPYSWLHFVCRYCCPRVSSFLSLKSVACCYSSRVGHDWGTEPTDWLTDTDWLTHPPPYVEFCPWATHLALMISLPLYHWLTNFYPYSGPFSSDTSECLLGVPTRSSTCLDVLRSSQTESHKTQLPFTSIMPFHMVPPYPLSHCVNLWAIMVLDWSLPNSILGRSRAGTTYFISVTLHSVHWVCSINMWDSGSKEDEGKQERMEPIWDSSVPDRNHN